MNTRRLRTLRSAWWLCALLQLVVPAASAAADALALGARADSGVHFEEERCVPSHPADCAHCSAWRNAVPLGDGVEPRFLATFVSVVARPERETPPTAVVSPSPLPRGPPALR